MGALSLFCAAAMMPEKASAKITEDNLFIKLACFCKSFAGDFGGPTLLPDAGEMIKMREIL